MVGEVLGATQMREGELDGAVCCLASWTLNEPKRAGVSDVAQ